MVAAASIASNVYYLHQAYGSYHYTSQLEKADLGAVEIARDSVEPGFVLSEDLADTVYVHVEAGPYLSARDEFGSPAYTPAELAEAPEFARFAADKVLSGALQIGLDQVPVSATPSGAAGPAKETGEGIVEVPASGCVAVAGASQRPLLRLPPGGVVVRAVREPIEDFRLRRFATEGFPIDFQQGLGAEAAGEVQIPTDRSKVPWKMEIDGAGPAIVCGTVGGG